MVVIVPSLIQSRGQHPGARVEGRSRRYEQTELDGTQIRRVMRALRGRAGGSAGSGWQGEGAVTSRWDVQRVGSWDGACRVAKTKTSDLVVVKNGFRAFQAVS